MAYPSKKLWQYGSRFARQPGPRFKGLSTGFGVGKSKLLGMYNLGWQSPSRTGRPTGGGLRYGPNIRNPIGLDVARARASAGARNPSYTMPGVGGGFGPSRQTGGGSMAEARRWI